jgi:peptide deformylase
MRIVTDRQQLSLICLPLAVEEQEQVFRILEETLRGCSEAIGVSAPQVGIQRRAFVYYSMVEDERKIIRVANPMMRELREPLVESREGCLSLPGVQCLVPRYSQCEASDDLGGTYVLTEMDAIVYQHELDHLDGLLMTDTGVVIPTNIGRNDPCFCGSGEKYKKCHGK